MSFRVPETHRIRDGIWGSDESIGNNGAFKFFIRGVPIQVIASDGEGWEHVSVSTIKRCPTWEEMCTVKHMFWSGEDCVVQYHPPESEYVNNHNFCLHLWRPTDQKLPRPESWMVGVKK